MFVWIKRIFKWIVVLGVVGGFIWVMFFLFWSQKSMHATTLTVLEGTQDGNVVIQTPFGHTIVVQTTRDANISEQLTRVLPFYQRHIDVLILAQLNVTADEKALQLFDQFDIGSVVLPSGLTASSFAKTIQKRIQEKKIPFELVEHAKIYEFVGEESVLPVRVQLLYPPDWESSVVPVRVMYGETSAFISGPLTVGGQEMLLQSFPSSSLVSDVLISPGKYGAFVKPKGLLFDSTTLTKEVVFELNGAKVTKKDGI